jgi:AcrR family transcriptional regulator
MDMAIERLSAVDWVRAGLHALAESGAGALKADSLARTLKVSRGSFYWHFADIDAFHMAVLQRWRTIAYENIVEELQGSAEERLRNLLSRAFRADNPLERAVRAWATSDATARAMVEEIDAKRRGYLQRLMIEAGIDAARAEARARILYWSWLGHVLVAEKPPSWTIVLDEMANLAFAADR